MEPINDFPKNKSRSAKRPHVNSPEAQRKVCRRPPAPKGSLATQTLRQRTWRWIGAASLQLSSHSSTSASRKRLALPAIPSHVSGKPNPVSTSTVHPRVENGSIFGLAHLPNACQRGACRSGPHIEVAARPPFRCLVKREKRDARAGWPVPAKERHLLFLIYVIQTSQEYTH